LTLLATAGVVTVSASSNPVPSITALSPASVAAGAAALTLTITGSGFVASSQIHVDGIARTSTFVSSMSLTTTLSASDVASAGSRSITVVSPSPGGGTSAGAAFGVTVPSQTPAITINGSSLPVSVASGSTIVVGISNGPANRSDFVVMVPAGSPSRTWGPHFYLSGTTQRPAAGMSSAAVTAMSPATSGTYEFRFYENDSWTLLATSSVLTVLGAEPALVVNGSAGAVTVPAGSTIAVTVTNGPGTISDYVVMVPAGAGPQSWGPFQYLSGSTARPVTGLRNATLSFLAPASGGTFEFRFFQNDGWTRLATSGVVTVTP
jgi:hypothetical protein